MGVENVTQRVEIPTEVDVLNTNKHDNGKTRSRKIERGYVMSIWNVKIYEVRVRMSPSNGGERVHSQFYTDRLIAEKVRDMAVAGVIESSGGTVEVAESLDNSRVLSNGTLVEIIEHSANKPWGES